MLRASLHLCGFALCLSTACGEAEPPRVAWHSEHFIYSADPRDESVCPEVLDTLERHFDTMQSALELDWKTGDVIEYRKWRDHDAFDRSAACPEQSGGCYRDGVIHSPWPFHTHELIHAYLAPIGSPPPLLIEGAAESLACRLRYGKDSVQSLSWDAEGPVSRYTGRALVTHVIHRFGFRRFLQFFGGDWSAHDTTHIAKRFLDTYGVSIDEVWQTARLDDDANWPCIPVWECAAPEMRVDTEVELTGSCGEPDVYRVIDVEEPRTTEIRFSSPGSLLACPASDDAPTPFFHRFVSERAIVELAPGRYVVSASAGTRVASESMAQSAGTDCASLEPLALEDSEILLLQPRTEAHFLRFAVPQELVFAVLAEHAIVDAVCPSCQRDERCVGADQAGELDSDGEVVIHLAPSPLPARPAEIAVSLSEP